MEIAVRPLLSHSNSFGFEMEKDVAGCRALNRNYYCRRKLLAHRRTAQEKMGAMTFSEMECDDFDFAGAESVPMEGFGEGR